jgi:excinuclease ABC subunit C
MVERIKSVETIIVDSEMEALILEANLIKKYLPPYNIMLKDDKDYIYIGITNADFPQVITVRKQDINKLQKHFGPFPSAKTVRNTLKQLRRVFPWCSNPPGPRNKMHRPCFYVHIGLCPGACLGAIEQEDYNRIITMFSKFMDGHQKELLDELAEEMSNLSAQTKFEDANRIKKVFNGVNYLLSPTSIKQYLENPNFLEDQNKVALAELQRVLNLPDFPRRIECYDISNFQGTDSTGSLVVLSEGEIDKSQYRKFKIKITGKPDDFAMHAEMMSRRLKHQEWTYPQVFIIDGGRGQVRAAQAELIKAGVNIPIFGLAKREEWIYPPEGEVIKLPKRSLALRMIQKIRDESHRFAITYHRKLRAKSFGIPK